VVVALLLPHSLPGHGHAPHAVELRQHLVQSYGLQATALLLRIVGGLGGFLGVRNEGALRGEGDH
jgi:hypothetical protein